MTLVENYNSEIFGQISPEHERYYEQQVLVGEHELRVDLNVSAPLYLTELCAALDMLDRLDEAERVARDALERDCLSKESVVRDYRDYIGELCDSGQLVADFGESQDWRSDAQAFLAMCYLKRAGFYPQAKHFLAVLDFTPHEDLDHVLVVHIDRKGRAVHVTSEN